MGNVKLTITIMLQALLAFSFYGFSLSAFADDAALPQEGAAQQRYKVELIRDKDYKCVQCHKDSKQTLAGSHGEDAMAALGKEVNCTQCHSDIGQITVMVLQPSFSIMKLNLKPAAIKCSSTLLQYSRLTSSVPTATNLRNYEKLAGTHDVHAKNLTCSNCHSVHAEKAKALSYDHKTTIKMCVDCHKDFNELREEEGK